MTFNKSDRTAYICNDVRPSLEDVQNSVVDWLAPMWPGPDAERLQAALSDALQALANLEAGAVAEGNLVQGKAAPDPIRPAATVHHH